MTQKSLEFSKWLCLERKEKNLKLKVNSETPLLLICVADIFFFVKKDIFDKTFIHLFLFRPTGVCNMSLFFAFLKPCLR